MQTRHKSCTLTKLRVNSYLGKETSYSRDYFNNVVYIASLHCKRGEEMRKLLLGLLFAFAFNAMPVAYADEEALPEVAPVDDPALPPLDAPAAE